MRNSAIVSKAATPPPPLLPLLKQLKRANWKQPKSPFRVISTIYLTSLTPGEMLFNSSVGMMWRCSIRWFIRIIQRSIWKKWRWLARLGIRASKYNTWLVCLRRINFVFVVFIFIYTVFKITHAYVHFSVSYHILSSSDNLHLLSSCRYKFDTPFEREIKSEVFKIVRRGREFGTPGFFFRVAIYVSLFATMQYLFATSTEFTATLEMPFGMGVWKGVVLAVVFGISQAFIGLNVQVNFSTLPYVLPYVWLTIDPYTSSAFNHNNNSMMPITALPLRNHILTTS